MVSINDRKKRHFIKLSSTIRLVAGACVVISVVSFAISEHLFGSSCSCETINPDVNLFTFRPCPVDSQKSHVIKGAIPQHRIAPEQVNNDTALSIRSTLVQLLTSLPDNNTQRELARATIQTMSPRRIGSGGITLATQGGVSKLSRLLDLTGRWLGPISCGVYLTTIEQIDEWVNFVHTHELIRAYVSFHILLEQPQLPANVNRHPINRLRNLALRNIDTEFVFINDIDFMTSQGAHDAVLPRLSNLQPKTMYVLPAFERFGAEKRGKGQVVTNITMIPANKKDLLQAIKTKTVAPFHEYFPPGHAPSNYAKWYDATDIYSIEYAFLYEPYVICHKEGLPQFFPTFRGFAFNKMSFFMEAHYMGYSFMVLPDQFVVHMNHGGRKGRNDKGGDSAYIKNDFREYLKRIYGVSQSELNKWK